MALPFDNQIEAITNDYFLADGGKAFDNYFATSFLLTHLLKNKKGMYKSITGGKYINVPIEYDEQNGGWYVKGESLNSDDVDIVMSAQFQLKHCYTNVTTYRIDELENAGPEQQVDLLATKLNNGQMSQSKLLADSIYDAPGGGSSRLTGLRALCNETSTLAYGGIAEDDLVSTDGTKVWEGKLYSSATVLSLDVLRDMKRKAKVNDGPKGKPDLFVTTDIIWNGIESILQVQQRLTEGKETAKAGFTGLYFIGMDVFPDDFCPASHAFALNTNYLGFGVHKNGNFVRTPWMVIPDSPGDRTMKLLFDGNMITSLRKAHQGYSAISY